jgi:hypothetical protein
MRARSFICGRFALLIREGWREKMCDIVKYLTLFLLFVLLPAANAQTRVNGNINSAFAVGKWKESHEGVSLFCARVTNQSEVIKATATEHVS